MTGSHVIEGTGRIELVGFACILKVQNKSVVRSF